MKSNILSWQIVLFPFAIIYYTVVFVRNVFFNIGILSSFSSEKIKIISVGNLSVGGTGKSPIVEYIINILPQKNKIGVLSRGYGRKTKGFYEVKTDSISQNVGDEPLMIKNGSPDTVVIVDENRVRGIKNLEKDYAHISYVILDDAFQHRYVKPNLQILLVDYSRPFYNDYVLPVGRLREPRSGYKRADIIIVTKCPKTISESEREAIVKNSKPTSNQTILFSYLKYAPLKQLGKTNSTELTKKHSVILITGIANPTPLYNYLNMCSKVIKHYNFNDHHNYSEKEINEIGGLLEANKHKNGIVVSTRKDAVKLKGLQINFPIYVQDISIGFIGESLETTLRKKMEF